ncbi:hypothetical protein, partial [uncultured Bartonella sp.]|uniref:hypothetical protein n=1 Tax=uncultured Bartonella sp. TaxID=104108 RepID=UPI0025D73803
LAKQNLKPWQSISFMLCQSIISTLSGQSFRLWQSKSQKGDLSLPERLHQARLCQLLAPVRVLPVPVTAAAVSNANTRSDQPCFCKALHSTM